jgi:hypothetical protein
MNEWTSAKVCDIANLVVGAILIFSPLIFGYQDEVATQNAIFSGFIIAVISAGALIEFGAWEEWLILSVGLWLIASPWILKFHGTRVAQVNIAIGIVVTVFAIVELLATTPMRPKCNRK